MKLIPAHVRDAKDMAKRLKESLWQFGLQRDCRIRDGEPPTLQQTQELMAKAMGYDDGWKQLSAVLVEPHKALYVDLLEQGQSLARDATTKLAALLGYDYMHGAVWNAWTNAGVGYSPKWRRALEDAATPWGQICDQEEIAAGVKKVATACHGGIVLSRPRQEAMPAHLRLEDRFYEEDDDWALVILAFPDVAPDRLVWALASVDVYRSNSVPRVWTCNTEDEAFLAKCLVGYVPPESDPMNRSATPEEEAVVLYLAACVQANKKPVRQPSELFPSLQDWVSCLALGPRVNGAWPMLSEAWRTHWG